MKKLSLESLKQILDSRFASDSVSSLKQLPKPAELKGMDIALKRIVSAIDNNQDIVIVGDYDVDGVISRVLLTLFFEQIEYKNISYITPDRFKDGYGISIELIRPIANRADVIITVDNGINANDVASFCKDNNIDLIVTDHHQSTGEMKDAYCVINPKHSNCTFPFKEICGAQIAWYLIAGLKNELNIKLDMQSLLDLLILAIIADVMPLVSINRIMVKKGLEVLNSSSRVCFQAIRQVLDKDEFKASDIAFLIAPKINVAGRLEHANLAISFLLEQDLDKSIQKFQYLCELINKRKKLEDNIANIIKDEVDTNCDVIVAYHESFHSGVIGIAASRVVNKYNKIALVGSYDKTQGIIKMSGRSYGGVDLYTLVSSTKDLLSSFGGHTQAIGLSIEQKNIKEFIKRINDNFKTHNYKYEENKNITGILDIDDINLELLDILDYYEPYGHANEMPTFMLKNINVFNIKRVGANKDCISVSAKNKHGFVNMIKFGVDDFDLDIRCVDIVCSIGKNVYKDNIKPSVYISEITPVASI